jgi:tRNA (uracil-5-)-methyltransferase
MQDPLIKKRKTEAENQGEKRLKSDESVEDQVKNVTVSLSHEPYAKQMEIKKKEMHSVLAKLTQEIRKANFKIKPYIDKQIEANQGLICPFSDVVESPVTSKYRNKCEFTVGKAYVNFIYLFQFIHLFSLTEIIVEQVVIPKPMN